MLVDDIGDVTITNDGATILKLLEVEHPAARVRAAAAALRLLRERQQLLGWHFDIPIGTSFHSIYPGFQRPSLPDN
jgi:hypothetical protein